MATNKSQGQYKRVLQNKTNMWRLSYAGLDDSDYVVRTPLVFSIWVIYLKQCLLLEGNGLGTYPPSVVRQTTNSQQVDISVKKICNIKASKDDVILWWERKTI